MRPLPGASWTRSRRMAGGGTWVWHLSAQLMQPPADLSEAPPQHLAYWGRFRDRLILSVGQQFLTWQRAR